MLGGNDFGLRGRSCNPGVLARVTTPILLLSILLWFGALSPLLPHWAHLTYTVNLHRRIRVGPLVLWHTCSISYLSPCGDFCWILCGFCLPLISGFMFLDLGAIFSDLHVYICSPSDMCDPRHWRSTLIPYGVAATSCLSPLLRFLWVFFVWKHLNFIWLMFNFLICLWCSNSWYLFGQWLNMKNKLWGGYNLFFVHSVYDSRDYNQTMGHDLGFLLSVFCFIGSHLWLSIYKL
jgi:hypothetical protein